MESAQVIRERRARAPDGLLLFDRLLQLAEVNGHCYPPENEEDVETLLARIASSATFDKLKIDALRLYLTLEQGDAGQTARFIVANRLPPAFVRCTKGYFALDHQRYDEAVKHLASPGVAIEFTAAILAMFAQSPRHLIDFLSLAKLALVEREDIMVVIESLIIEGKANEALNWARRGAPVASSEARSELIHFLLATVFGSGRRKPVNAALQLLLSLPLDEDEDAAMLAFVQSPPNDLAKRELVVDWAVARLIAQSRHAEARRLLANAPSLPSNLADLRDKRRQTIRTLDLVLHGGKDLDLGYDLDAPLNAPPKPTAVTAMDVDITQPAWAPPVAKPPSRTPPKSVLEARQQAEQQRRDSLPPALSARDLPLSGSPHLARVPASGLPLLSSSASPFKKQQPVPRPASVLGRPATPSFASPRPSSVYQASPRPSIAPAPARAPPPQPEPEAAEEDKSEPEPVPKPSKSRTKPPPAKKTAVSKKKQQQAAPESPELPGAWQGEDAMEGIEEPAPLEDVSPVAQKTARGKKSAASRASVEPEVAPRRSSRLRSKAASEAGSVAGSVAGSPPPETPRKGKGRAKK